MPEAKKSIETMSFEAALDELQAIVKNLESGQTALDDSVAAYERGVALRQHCEKKLRDARSKIEAISIGDDGSVTTKPFKTQE